MAYTLTFDCSPSAKVKQGGSHATNHLRHVYRDGDEKMLGVVRGHSNPDIDRDRGHLNISMVNDAAGGFIPGNSALVAEYLDSRLETVTRKLRKDAVVIRPVVLQVDPIYVDEQCPDWRETGLNDEVMGRFDDLLDWAKQQFGQQNICGYALHLDEGSPQLHVTVTPVTDDGRLSQKDFFKGPGHLTNQHKNLREFMRSRGFDAEMAVSPRSKERLNSDAFKKAADRAKHLNEQLEDRSDFLDRREAALDKKEAALDKKDHRLDLVDRTQARLKKALEARESALKGEMDDLPRLRSQARSEGHTEGYEAGQAEGQDAVAMARQLLEDKIRQQEIMNLTHAKRLAELEEQANEYVRSQTPPMPPMDEIKKSMSSVAIDYISWLDKKRPGPGYLAAFDKFAKKAWEQQVLRKTGFAQKPKISLQDFTVRSVETVAQERVERTSSFQEQLRKYDESQQQAWEPDISGWMPGK